MVAAPGIASAAIGARQRPRRRATALIAYFDTSALIKLLVEEHGSDVATDVWTAAVARVSSELVYPEGRAALAAAQRDGRLSRGDLGQAVRDLADACDAMELVAVDRVLARAGGRLAEAHRLRGYDAVHLATALSVTGSDVVLVTWDRDLARAAGEAGRLVVPS